MPLRITTEDTEDAEEFCAGKQNGGPGRDRTGDLFHAISSDEIGSKKQKEAQLVSKPLPIVLLRRYLVSYSKHD